MEWQAIVAIVVAAPVVLLPAAFIGYLTIGGIAAAIREGRTEKAPARRLVPHLHRA